MRLQPASEDPLQVLLLRMMREIEATMMTEGILEPILDRVKECKIQGIGIPPLQHEKCVLWD